MKLETTDNNSRALALVGQAPAQLSFIFSMSSPKVLMWVQAVLPETR